MKITKSQLKQIIKEELDEALPLQSSGWSYEKEDLDEGKLIGKGIFIEMIKRVEGISKTMSLFDVATIDEALFNELQDAMSTLQQSYEAMIKEGAHSAQLELTDAPPEPAPKKFSWTEE